MKWISKSEVQFYHRLRVDERYDSNSSGTITSADSWRRLHENSHRPGSLSHLLAKKVYNYASGTTGTPSGSTDYFYGYDPVGNVVAISNGAGTRQYAFLQDAWGNELSVGAFTGDSWTTAWNAGVWEHQTGKWIDPFTGLYYFHARFYDSKVGRFVGRDPVKPWGKKLNVEGRSGCCSGGGNGTGIATTFNPYAFVFDSPCNSFDPSGKVAPALALIPVYEAMAYLAGLLATSAFVCINADAIEAAISDLMTAVAEAGALVTDSLKDAIDYLISKARDLANKCSPCPPKFPKPNCVNVGPMRTYGNHIFCDYFCMDKLGQPYWTSRTFGPGPSGVPITQCPKMIIDP